MQGQPYIRVDYAIFVMENINFLLIVSPFEEIPNIFFPLWHFLPQSKRLSFSSGPQVFTYSTSEATFAVARCLVASVFFPTAKETVRY